MHDSRPDTLPLPEVVKAAVDHAAACTTGYIEAQLDMLPGDHDAETAYLAAVMADLADLVNAPLGDRPQGAA